MQTYSDIRIFCSVIQYIVSKKHEVSGDSSEIIFDEAHFIVNLQSFLQPLALPWHTFPQIESFVPHSPRQNNFQNSSPLDTSETALVCIFSSILNHSYANQKNSIIRDWKKCYILFCHQKTIKNRQALHEIIRASSLYIIFVELSFNPVHPTLVVKNFKFMENYNS